MKRKLNYRSPGTEDDADRGWVGPFLREYFGEMAAHLAGFVIMAIAALLVFLLFRWLGTGA